MNTERPDHDDAEAEAGAEAVPSGGARHSGDASGEGGAQGAPEEREHREREAADGAGPASAREERGGLDGSDGSDEREDLNRPGGSDEREDLDRPGGSDEREDLNRPGGSDEPKDLDRLEEREEPENLDRPDGSDEPEDLEVGDVGAASGRPGEPGAHGADGAPAPRRRSPVLIASVAAAVLLVGGGGAWLASGAAGDPGGRTAPGANGDATLPPLALDGHSEGGGGSPGIAPGEPNPYGATYRADGTLPDGPGSAPVYRAGGQITREQVAALAKALGIDGKPVAQGGSWRIGGRDGSGPGLRVDRQAPGTWTFSRYAPGTDNCKGATCKAPSADGPAVSEEAAKKAAAPVLKAVGQDDAKLDARQVRGGNRVVNADPEIGGLPTHGWTTGVIVGATGEVVGGSGRLSKPVKGDTYPVVSAEEALDLMNAAPGAGRRTGIGGCASPVPLGEPERQEPCGAVTTLPDKDTLTVEKAVFGLAAHAVDGRPALVPSWLFEARPEGAEDALTVTYPAVDPEYLAPQDRSGKPSAEPTAPGDEPTGATTTRNVAVEGYTAEGTELTVGFTGGVCAAYETTVSESADRVTVTVTETQQADKVCILIAKQYRQTVRLQEPLGDREVVGADGEPVPLLKEGARLPAPSSGAR